MPFYYYDFSTDKSAEWTLDVGTWNWNTELGLLRFSGTNENRARITGSEAGLTFYKARVRGWGGDGCVPGIIFGYQDADNFYHARICEYYDELQLYKWVDGVPTKIGSYSITIDLDTWYVIKVEWLAADHVKVYLDGILRIDQTTDLEAWTSGGVGLKSYHGANEYADFDYIKVGPTAFKVTVAEKLGMVDAVTKKAAYKQLAAEKLGMVDAVKPVRGLHVTAAEKLGLKDAVKSARGLHVTVAEKLGLVDDYFKRLTAGRLGDNPDNVGSRGSPVYKDMPDYMGAVYVNTKNTWQDAENLDDVHGYTSYVWIPEECFKVKILKLHVYAEKFRAHSKAAKEATPDHTHDVIIGAKTSTSVKPDHTHNVVIGAKTSESGGGLHSHVVAIGTKTSTDESTHKHKLGSLLVKGTAYQTGYFSVFNQAEVEIGLALCEFTSQENPWTFGAAIAHNHDVVIGAPTSSAETPDHTHNVDYGTKTSASGGASHAHSVDYATKTSESGAGVHGHEIDYGIWEEPDISGRTLKAKLYDPNDNLLATFDPLTTGEEDVILDLTEYFKDLKYGMYRLELEASDRIRVRLVYYELGIMFAM